MSTPEENFEIAIDESSNRESRKRAIGDLETANDCDRLAELARMDALADRYRERAVAGMAHPQCKSMLQSLVESGELPESLRDRAETLLEETPDNSGAGP